jgi:hypothetical protein
MHVHHKIRMCSEHTCVAHRWNPGSGSKRTHVSQQLNSGTGPERTNVWTVASYDGIVRQVLNIPICHPEGILDQALNVCVSWRWNSGTGSERTNVWTIASYDGIVKQVLNIPICHPEGILDQALNVRVSWRWNSGTGSEHMRVSQRWNSVSFWTHPNVTETEFWKRFWAYPQVTDGILEEAVAVLCQRRISGQGYGFTHASQRILDQALNVPMCHRWNCGIGFDCIHLSWR